MIYLIFGALLMLLWYLADKNLKDHFLPYLKWPALLFAMYFIAYDIYFQIELERIIHIDEDHLDGVTYSYWDAPANATVEVDLYAKQGTDRGQVFAYFKSEQELDQVIGGLLPELLMICAFGIIVQTIMIVYGRYANGQEEGKA